MRKQHGNPGKSRYSDATSGHHPRSMSCGSWHVVHFSLSLAFRGNTAIPAAGTRNSQLRDLSPIPPSRSNVSRKSLQAAFPEHVESSAQSPNLRMSCGSVTAVGFQMALHTHFHLAVRTQFFRIDDRRADLYQLRPSFTCRLPHASARDHGIAGNRCPSGSVPARNCGVAPTSLMALCRNRRIRRHCGRTCHSISHASRDRIGTRIVRMIEARRHGRPSIHPSPHTTREAIAAAYRGC